MSLAHYSHDERMIEGFDRVYQTAGSPIIDRTRRDEVYA
jgi:hypothetical protein